MGTVRIRYTNKISVFEYPGMRKEDAAEKVREHLAVFAYDVTPDSNTRKVKLEDSGKGIGFTPVAVDYSTVIAEWIEKRWR